MMDIETFWRAGLCLLVVSAASATSTKIACAAQGPDSTATLNTAQTGSVPQLTLINDPAERMNRGTTGFNDFLIDIVLDPLAMGYLAIFPQPARESIKKAGYNIEFPVRLINTLLQGKFKGAGVETERFLVNTTVGVLGFFDPATRWGIKTYDEDFGQTFAHYGAGWGAYLVLPLFGPTSVRDGLGLPLDSAANPASYVFVDNFFMFNDLSFLLPQLQRVDEMMLDPYATDRDMWALRREVKVRDFDQSLPPASNTSFRPGESTLDAVKFQPRDPTFFKKLHTRDVNITATGRKLPYSYRIQKKGGPLVYIVSGIGMHRFADSALALAEMLWNGGYSVVTVSNPSNWEFNQAASSTPVPGNTPVDAHDLYDALDGIDRELAKRYPGRIHARACMGTSLGALQGAFISELERTRPKTLRFARYVLISPPVDPSHALERIDAYYQAALQWPEPERKERMMATLLKIRVLMDLEETRSDQKVEFDVTECRFLIGYYYRRILQEMLFCSQRRQNMGLVQGSFGRWRRQPTYDAIARYSWTDYINELLLPYYLHSGASSQTTQTLIAGANMRALAPGLKANEKIRVYCSSDDFVLSPDDLAWLKGCFGPRLTLFPNGGHLGNLYQDAVQQQIMRALADLDEKGPRSAAWDATAPGPRLAGASGHNPPAPDPRFPR